MNRELARRRHAGTSYVAGGEGPPVVFLHGVPGSALIWESVASRLTDACRVIVPDLRGFGHSDPPTGDYYMAGQARAIADLLDALDIEDCTLVTHDFGGPVGLTMLRLGLGPSVERLVLSATNVFTDTYVPVPLRVARIPLLNTLCYTLLFGNRVGLRMLYRNAVVQKETATWSDFRRHLTPSGMAMTRRIFQRSIANLEANYREIEGLLSEIAFPTLVLWGDADPLFGVAVGERTQQAIPTAELVVYEQTGHFVPEERPTEVASAVRDLLEAP